MVGPGGLRLLTVTSGHVLTLLMRWRRLSFPVETPGRVGGGRSGSRLEMAGARERRQEARGGEESEVDGEGALRRAGKECEDTAVHSRAK